jgi:hypothetical protein
LWSGFSERASFSRFCFDLFFFLGYHCYRRELGHQHFFCVFTLIMAGSWGGYLIAFTARRVEIQATSGIGLRKKMQQCNPTSAETEGRDTPFSSLFFYPLFLVGSLWEQGSGGWL